MSVNGVHSVQKSVRSVRRALWEVGFFSLFINLLMLTPPLYMLQLYDRVVTSRSQETLLMLTLIVVILFGVMGVLEFVRSRLLIRAGNRLDRMLGAAVFDAMFRLSLERGGGTPQPLHDLASIRQFITGNGPFAFFDAPWIPIYLGVLFLFHPLYGGFAVGAILFQLVVAITNELTTRRPLAESTSRTIASNQTATANLRNAEVIQALGMGTRLRQLWSEQHLAGVGQQSLANDRATIWMNLSKVGRILSQSLMLGLGGYLAITDQISPGMMIAGSIIMGRAMAPIDLMVGSWKGFSSARSAYRRLDELLRHYPPADSSMSLPPPLGALTLEKVVAAPPGRREPVLKGISLSLQPGELLGVVGPSAAGKSSLARVVLGVWPAMAGEVRIDGAAIAQWNRDELGPHLGYLPQDIELFSGSVAENIARFGAVESERVIAAARMAGVHELILALPEGYETPIGAAGAALSGGQRQRIGLARALYGEPRMVVLDEPNSNLDEPGERALVETLQRLRQQQVTVVLITHQAALLRHIDRILVLREGRVWRLGGRDELAAELEQARNGQRRGAPRSPSRPPQQE